MAISNTKFQQIVLERLIEIESQISAGFELQAIEGEAINVQLNAILSSMSNKQFEQINITPKYREFYEGHRKRITKEVVSALRENESDDLGDDPQLIDILQ